MGRLLGCPASPPSHLPAPLLTWSWQMGGLRGALGLGGALQRARPGVHVQVCGRRRGIVLQRAGLTQGAGLSQEVVVAQGQDEMEMKQGVPQGAWWQAGEVPTVQPQPRDTSWVQGLSQACCSAHLPSASSPAPAVQPSLPLPLALAKPRCEPVQLTNPPENYLPLLFLLAFSCLL